MTEIHELGVAESAKQIREGALSAVKLAEVLLARIEAHSELKAWVYLDRDAVLAAAQTCDAAQRKGEGKGALHEFPLGSRTFTVLRAFQPPRVLRCTLTLYRMRTRPPWCDLKPPGPLFSARQ